MKQITLILFFFLCYHHLTFSQTDKGLFYKISLATTLSVNEDYNVNTDDDETLIEPNAYFINNTIGYKLSSLALIGLNIEYNWHSKQRLNFFPVYLNFQYNIYDDDDNIFIRGGYGKLMKIGKNFQKGNLYKLGAGYEITGVKSENSLLIGLDFTRKNFAYKNLEKLSSVSIFIEFMLF